MSVTAPVKFKTFLTAPVLILFFLTILNDAAPTRDGLSRRKQEHLVDKGVLAGSDFLNILLRESDDYKNSIGRPKTTKAPKSLSNISVTKTRVTRSTASNFLEVNRKPKAFNPTSPSLYLHDNKLERNLSNDEVIVSIRVSSTINRNVGRKAINRKRKSNSNLSFYSSNDLRHTQDSEASENHPVFIEAKFDNEPVTSLQTPSSIVSESKRNNFALEEKEPVVTNTNPTTSGLDLSLQPVDFNFRNKKADQYHQSIVYHDNDPEKARSVSYSSVIQDVPLDSWDEPHERQERNYDNSKSTQLNGLENNKLNLSSYTYYPEKKTDWSEKTSTQKPRHWVPSVRKSYTQPEENYEIDEHASVVSNGRIHGVQVKNNKEEKVDDNQKVGYVVEGRNYRKYRVEERTSDGFIVGEYGVVSHNDGSLRGVRYTADGNTNPRLIYDALMKFLSL